MHTKKYCGLRRYIAAFDHKPARCISVRYLSQGFYFRFHVFFRQWAQTQTTIGRHETRTTYVEHFSSVLKSENWIRAVATSNVTADPTHTKGIGGGGRDGVRMDSIACACLSGSGQQGPGFEGGEGGRDGRTERHAFCMYTSLASAEAHKICRTCA